MTDEKALVKAPIHSGDMGLQLKTFDDFQRFASIAVAAGIVGAKESPQTAIAKAVIAIQYGAELGIPPLASLSNVHVINGRPTIAPVLMAARLIEKGYQYRIAAHTDEQCSILFANSRGVDLGESKFTIADATAAGLIGGGNSHNWKKYPRNMLFARAMSNGVRWFCPDVFLGAAYTDDEIIDMVTPEPVAETPTVKSKNLKELVKAKAQSVAPIASEVDPFEALPLPATEEVQPKQSTDGGAFDL